MIIGNFNGWNIIAPPQAPAFMQAEISAEDVIGESEAPFSLHGQQQDWMGDRWSFHLALPPMPVELAAPWFAWLLEMRGKLNVFPLADPLGTPPAGAVQGAPVSNGVNLARARVLNTKGWTPSIQGQLLVGTYLQIGQRLHCVIGSDVDSDSGGLATIGIWPSIREATADGDPIVLAKPTGLFRMVNNKRTWSIATTKFFGIQIEVKEAL